jgi:hypothetical protein
VSEDARIEEGVKPMLVACERNHREKRINPARPTPSKISLVVISVPKGSYDLQETEMIREV